jgi:signal transduction histidine kinase
MKAPSLLIIDDDALARETLAALLVGSGYNLEFAHSGADGIKVASAVDPEVILLDLMMPDMDGFEVCRILRENPKHAEVPIILVTALDDRETRLRGLDSGADDFLSKPIDSLELEIRLNTLKQVARYRHLIAERRKVDRIRQKLETQNKELQKLSAQVLEAHEAENRHLAMELHDEVGQMLTGLKMLLENGKGLDQPGQAEVLNQGVVITDDLLHKVRELTLNLRPTVLDDFGLWSALDWLFQRVHKQTGLLIKHNIDPLDERRFPRTIETACFRMVQESLTNIVRHANVHEATVIVDDKRQMLRISVLDSGTGFDMQKLPAGNSVGVSGMRERVKLAGGKFNVHTSPGEGTLVSAEFRLEKREDK